MFTIKQNSTNNLTQIFDRLNSVQLVVNASEYEIVLSYFKTVTDKVSVAETFTSLLFKVSQVLDLSVLEMLENLKSAENRVQMNQVMAFYLNSIRSKTSMYGTGLLLRPNEPVQRNVVI